MITRNCFWFSLSILKHHLEKASIGSIRWLMASMAYKLRTTAGRSQELWGNRSFLKAILPVCWKVKKGGVLIHLLNYDLHLKSEDKDGLIFPRFQKKKMK